VVFPVLCILYGIQLASSSPVLEADHLFLQTEPNSGLIDICDDSGHMESDGLGALDVRHMDHKEF
jgi:hypothetical protein